MIINISPFVERIAEFVRWGAAAVLAVIVIYLLILYKGGHK